MRRGIATIDQFYASVTSLTDEVRANIGPYAEAVTLLATANLKLLDIAEENRALLKQAVALLEQIAKKPK